MFLSFIVTIALSLGGVAVTYLFEDDEPLLWRLAAGCVLGFALFGTIGFVVTLLSGLSVAASVLILAIALAPLALLLRKDIIREGRKDWQKAKGKLQGADLRKFSRFLYYAVCFVLLWLFFDQAMIVKRDGIFTGDSHNLGDLPFHLGAIFSFTDGNNFPPENPSFAGAKFSYPFIADLVTAIFMKMGAGLRDSMFVQNLAWAFSLFILLERFVLRLTGERLAGRLAPVLLYLSGGLGFIWFFKDYGINNLGFTDFLWKLPADYTINDDFAWGNSLTTLFLTQRSLLIGMPLAIVVLHYLWKVYARATDERPKLLDLTPSLVVGAFAGMLPMIHLHSLAVLFVVTAFLFLFSFRKWEYWIAFGVAVAAVAVPELLWSLTGSASKAGEFIGWHFGWDAGEKSFLYFWILNTGLVIPLTLLGGYLVVTEKREKGSVGPDGKCLLLFYVPFLACFVIGNITKLAPWPWDNIKVLIYWFVGSLPLICFALARMWEKNYALKAAAVISVIILTFTGALDVWRTVSGQIDMKVFDSQAVQIADQIRERTHPRALFLNAPTYNSAVVLTGRPSVMRFTGHLWSHGIDYGQREKDVKDIYAGGPTSDQLIRQYGIDYVIISPEERASVSPNEQYFQKFPVIAEAGQSRVYKVR